MKKSSYKLITAGIALVIVLAVAYISFGYYYFGKFRHRLINYDFSMKKIGWLGNGGEIRTADDGNRYAANGYNWGLYQAVSVAPGGSYTLAADTMKGTAETAARLSVVFLTRDGAKVPGYTINYWHTGEQWESIPPQSIKAPENAERMLIYLLTLNEPGYHYFDNICLEGNDSSLPPPPSAVNINPPTDPAENRQRTPTPGGEVPDTSSALSERVAERSVAASGENRYHVVKKGETLSRIAMDYNVDLNEVVKANNIVNPNILYPGQKLVIPGR